MIPEKYHNRILSIKTELLECLPRMGDRPTVPLDRDGKIDWKNIRFKDYGPRNTVLPTFDNFRLIIGVLGINIRYNLIKKETEIVIPDFTASVDNYQNAAFAFLGDEMIRCGMNTARLKELILAIGDGNYYNPISTWIETKPWDGVDRLQDFYNTVKTYSEHEGLKKILMYRWCLAAIAALYDNSNNSVSRGVLVFQAHQYAGKTSWIKSLVPEQFNAIKDGVSLNADDKDSIYKSIKYWLVELGEIDSTFKRSDISKLKAFLSESHDELRRPYAQSESLFKRRTVFFGSVNEPNFLADKTGNSRYWVIPCLQINAQHGIDMQQFWAQIKIDYDNGEKWFLSREEMDSLNSMNRHFEFMDAIEERIPFCFEWDSLKTSWKYLTSTEIARRMGLQNPSSRDLGTIKRTILRFNGDDYKRQNNCLVMNCPPEK